MIYDLQYLDFIEGKYNVYYYTCSGYIKVVTFLIKIVHIKFLSDSNELMTYVNYRIVL